DEGRLRLLALCQEEELTVGELATLLDESQPQVTKKSQPLREAGLLSARRDGTRTLLRAAIAEDAVVSAALEEGRALCLKDGSLARVAAVVAQREEVSRRFFDEKPAAAEGEVATTLDHELLSWLPVLAPLLPGRALAVDVGTGEGTLLPLLSPLYERVVAVDRSPARLARCGARLATWGLPNVRLREGHVEDPDLLREISSRGGADLVLMARVLHHAARPAESITAAARMLRAGGHLLLVDYLPHEEESMRDQGDVWLGFDPGKLRAWIEGAGLEVSSCHPLPAAASPRLAHHSQLRPDPPLQLALGRRPQRTLH
ncbi:MAG: methyltransferase domain-containing protein, partial [Myxococcales bacterium]|nr:methyltransferase domain-containing protein [Myxococcales bacterium]